MEEWIIIILLVIFVIMFLTLKPIENTILFNKAQTQTVKCYEDNQTDLVMLPKPNPATLIIH
jgi:hypothetical protein